MKISDHFQCLQRLQVESQCFKGKEEENEGGSQREEGKKRAAMTEKEKNEVRQKDKLRKATKKISQVNGRTLLMVSYSCLFYCLYFSFSAFVTDFIILDMSVYYNEKPNLP